MSPNRLLSIIQPFLVMLMAIFVIVLIYGWISSDEYDDDFSVTITYDCTRVITERNYPGEVLQECLELRDELARKNK